jgi:putative oxidoreductase
MKKLLTLSFVPRCTDLGLLVLRLTLGLAMVWLHGLGKLTGFAQMSGQFPSVFGLGSSTSLVLAIVGEVVFPALIIVGLFTRFAALGTAITMAVAFFAIHGGALSGQSSGELAFLYMVGFGALIFSGAGRHSLDAKLGNG